MCVCVLAAESSAHCFHVPYLFLSSDDRKQQPVGQQRGNGLKDLMFSTRPCALGTSAMLPQLSFASSRSFHALSRPSLPAAKGLGLGLSMPSIKRKDNVGIQAQQSRSLTDGELIGAAYLLTTDIMFWSGLIGAVVFRRNIIVMLLCTEIVMLACNMNFLFGSAYFNDMTVSKSQIIVLPCGALAHVPVCLIFAWHHPAAGRHHVHHHHHHCCL